LVQVDSGPLSLPLGMPQRALADHSGVSGRCSGSRSPEPVASYAACASSSLPWFASAAIRTELAA
jgi:hypothetical protein